MAAKKKPSPKPKMPKPAAQRAPKAPTARNEPLAVEEPEDRPSLGDPVPEDNLAVISDLHEANRIFAATMNKDGRQRVVMANDAPNTYYLRRPTGIMNLDIDIGGGFPAGGLSILSGPDNAGKTWVLYRTMAMHQRLYGAQSNIILALAEGGFDFSRALATGLVVSVPDEILSSWNQFRLLTNQPPMSEDEIRWYKRQIGGFMIVRGATGEETMHMVKEAVATNKYSIVGIDSISILLPEADEDKGVGETPKRAGNANLMTDFIRKYTPHTSGIFNNNPTTVIGIMQVRSNADKANAQPHIQKYLKDWAVTGAYAVRHGKLVDVTIWDGSLLRRTEHGMSKVYGKTLHWKIEKGKAGCHDNVSGETEFLYPDPTRPESIKGHDDAWSVIIAGMARGVIFESKGKVDIYHPVTREKTDLGGFRTTTDLHKAIVEDFEFDLHLRYYVLLASGVQCLYRPLA
jgi:RecA/RadA recombinase